MGTLTSYILDTCTLIWLCTDPKRISETAREAIETTQAPLLLSDVSAIEIALKWQSGKIALPDPPRHWLEKQIAIWGLKCLALSRSDIYRTTELPNHHKDPFDRWLVATALGANATILTPGTAIRQYPVSCLW